MRAVLAGFGPFPGAPFNPSAVLVEALGRAQRPALAGIDYTTHVFATTYASVDRDLPKLFAEIPDIVLMFGLAAGRRHLCIETRARNTVSVRHLDASGHRPTCGVISPRGPAALCGNAPSADLLGAVRASGFPVRLSRDAGRYLCNYAYWQALERARSGRPLVQFVHIPPVFPEQPSFGALVAAAEALLIALVAASRR
jgi:pyroglutamyl-peptidase